MIRTGGRSGKAGAAALVLLLAPAPLLAQSTPDFSLPGTRPTTNPRAQGPVDDDHPVIRPTQRATPAPTPTPTPVAVTPSPTPSASNPATTQPRGPSGTLVSPRPATGAAAPRARPGTAPTQVPAPATPTGAAASGVEQSGALPTDAVVALPGATASDSMVLPQSLDDTGTAAPGWYWPWIAGAATLLAALFGMLWWRRRKAAPKLLEFERPVVPQPEPESAEPEAAAPAPTPIAPQPLPEPQLSATVPGLAIALEARRMNASLVATTLSYVVKLTNTTDQPLSALAVEGDMVAAHASLPPDKQIASDSQRLELRHALVSLAPGESAEFKGDFRLPLATLVPIRAGNAAYFIPLARLRVEASTPSGAPLVKVQTWVVGELPEQPGAALRPFRLDLGPRTYSRVGQRAVN